MAKCLGGRMSGGDMLGGWSRRLALVKLEMQVGDKMPPGNAQGKRPNEVSHTCHGFVIRISVTRLSQHQLPRSLVISLQFFVVNLSQVCHKFVRCY